MSISSIEKRTKKRLDKIVEEAMKDKNMIPCPKCHGKGRIYMATNVLTPTGTDITKAGICRHCRGDGWFPI